MVGNKVTNAKYQSWVSYVQIQCTIALVSYSQTEGKALESLFNFGSSRSLHGYFLFPDQDSEKKFGRGAQSEAKKWLRPPLARNAQL